MASACVARSVGLVDVRISKGRYENALQKRVAKVSWLTVAGAAEPKRSESMGRPSQTATNVELSVPAVSKKFSKTLCPG